MSERQMSSVNLLVSLGCGALLCLGTPVMSEAGVMSYTDDAGIVHFTNTRVLGAPSQKGEGSNMVRSPSDVASRVAGSPMNRSAIDEFIREAATYYSLPPALVKAVVAAESAFDPTAISRAGAQGLMQLRPQTAAAMSVSDSFDPKENIYGGTRYLRLMVNQFRGDVMLAAAAYNAGPAAVEQANGIPPFQETRAYVTRVLKLYRLYQGH